jgi:copper chaperone CopZ
MTQILKIEGMTCGGCSSAVNRALQAAFPDEIFDVTLEPGQVTFADSIPADKVAALIEDAGFDVVA